MQNTPAIALASTAALASLISYLTLTAITVPAILPQNDKLQHVLAFAALAFPIAALRPRWLVVALPVFAGFGAVIELIQPYVGRSQDLMDWLADLAGIGIGAVAGLFLNRLAFLLRRT